MEHSATVHRVADIERLLSIGLTPITDNAAALAELGFTRRYPEACNGYEASVYERFVDRGFRRRNRQKRSVLVNERALLRR